MTLLNESRAADISLKSAELMIETAQLYYDTALDKLNSGVLTESESQFIFMEAEAAVKKSKNALLRAIQKVIEFIKNAIAKISKAFSDMKMKKDIEAIKKIQNDPDVKNIKVEIPDYKEQGKNINEYEKSIKDAEKKAKTGNLTQADIDKMNAAKKKCTSKKKMIAIGAAAGAVAIGGLVIASKSVLQKIENDTKKMENELENLQKDYDASLSSVKNELEKRNQKAIDKYKNAIEYEIFLDHEFDRISIDQKLIEESRAFRVSLVKEHEMYINKLKAEYQILYGSAWRKCITAIKSFLSDKDYKPKSKESIRNEVWLYRDTLNHERRSVRDLSRDLHRTKKRDKIRYEDELKRRKEEGEHGWKDYNWVQQHRSDKSSS